MKIIFICGQGGTGKSTLAKKILKSYGGEAKIISMDALRREDPNIPNQKVRETILNQIQNSFNEDLVIVDYALDTVYYRKEFFSCLTFPDDTELIIIGARPSLDTVFQWQEKRQNSPLSETQISKCVQAYNRFQAPTTEEFNEFKLKEITALTIDTSQLGDI